MGSNVELGGLRRWATRQVTVTSTGAVRLDSPLAGRNGVEVAASSANTSRVFCGPSSTSATASAGRAVAKLSAPLYLGISTRAAVFGRSTTGSQVMFVTEIA